AGQPEEMRLFRSDPELVSRQRQTRRRVVVDSRALRPARSGAFPERPAVDDGPVARGGGREGGQGFPGECLYGEDPVAVELPESFAGADPNARRHAADHTRSRSKMRGRVDGSRLESKHLVRFPSRGDDTRETNTSSSKEVVDDFAEAHFERARSLAAE